MTPSERIRRMIDSGSVAPEEGARLLAAMGGSPPSRSSLFVDPFERFGGGTAAALGALVAATSVAVSVRLGVRFDGLLDLHFSRAVLPSLRVALVDQLAGWMVPGLGYWAYARAVTRHVRVIDFVGMAGLARLPILAGGLALLPLVPSTIAVPPKPTPALLALALVALLVVVANVTWLYKGFKNASGLSGTKLVGGFSVLTIVLEALSKGVIFVAAKL